MSGVEGHGGIEIPDKGVGVFHIRDVIVCASSGDDIPLEEFRAHPPVGKMWRKDFENAVDEVDLGDGIKLMQFEHSEEIFDACGPSGPNFNPVRQFGEQYSFVRERDSAEVEESLFGFDEDGRLQHALCLSRLVRDNGFSFQYGARVIEGPGEKRTIRPFGATDGNAAYRILEGAREWLDGNEAQVLADLLAEFHDADLPARVKEALWRSEFATRMQRIDMMVFVIVSGLEALLKVGRGRATSQFKRRVTALAAEMEVDGVDEGVCACMYDARSGWAHGHQIFFDLADPPTPEEERRVKEEVALFRDVLRCAIRQAIEDADFRAIFDDDNAITERWDS